MAYVPLRIAVKTLGLHANTLRKYADNGQISSIKNEGGQRLYDVESYINGAVKPELICYCRVSSHKQKDDLERQIQYMQGEYPEASVIKDIGSGLNFKRKGLRTLLDKLMRGSKLTLVVACRDRLTRFGFELFQHMVEQNGGSIVVLSQPEHCPESELTADLLAIIHVFSCRMHGLRKYGKKIKKDPSLPDSSPADDS